MSVRIIKQKQEKPTKTSANGEPASASSVLIESTLLLMPDQPHVPIVSFEKTKLPESSIKTRTNLEPTRTTSTVEHSATIPSTTTICRRSATYRVHVPILNASQWFNGPNMQHERTDRMEKVVSSLVRRSFRPSLNYGYAREN